MGLEMSIFVRRAIGKAYLARHSKGHRRVFGTAWGWFGTSSPAIPAGDRREQIPVGQIFAAASKHSGDYRQFLTLDARCRSKISVLPNTPGADASALVLRTAIANAAARAYIRRQVRPAQRPSRPRCVALLREKGGAAFRSLDPPQDGLHFFHHPKGAL